MFKKVAKFLFIVTIFLSYSKISSADTLGGAVSFNVDPDYVFSGKAKTDATLQYVSQNAYFYFDNDWWNSTPGDKLAFVRDLANEFDQNIYPQLRTNFGSEWTPGIDSDPKITILFAHLKDNAGGFFNTHDEYTKDEFADSNQREMIYLNTTAFSSSRLKGFLAHEFQHLITFYQRDKLNSVSDDTFLNEARSEYAATLLGYDNSFIGSNLEKRIRDFLIQPSTSLTEWKNQPVNYGDVNLFMQYLVEHYGAAILKKMMLSPKVGIDSINDALSGLGFKETFSDVFADWVIALYANDCQSGIKYCFLNDNIREHLKVLPASTYTFPSSGSNAMMVVSMTKDWTPRWFKFTGGNQNLKLDFGGSANGQFRVPYIITSPGGKNEIRFFNLKNQEGTVYIPNFGSDTTSVTLIPFTQTKTAGFTSEEPYYTFSFAATIIPSIPVDNSTPTQPEQPQQPTAPQLAEPKIPSYPSGSLIRAQGDSRVYVINGHYKRWIMTPQIFNAYGHFKWENIIEVAPAERDWYQESRLVRTDGDTRVFEIDGGGLKHWLRMTPERFVATSHAWDAIFIINTRERDLYRTGVNIR